MFSRGNLAAAEEVHRFDTLDLRNLEQADGSDDAVESDAVVEEQGEIALDRGEPRERPVMERSAPGRECPMERFERELGEKHVLPQLEFFGHAASDLPGHAEIAGEAGGGAGDARGARGL